MHQTHPLPGVNLHLPTWAPTPMVPVQVADDRPVIWCKQEYFNPSGSTKDRIAKFILTSAFRDGRVSPGDTVIEASSGSTSIAMAMVCAQLGLRFIAVMPEGVSNERSLMIAAYGGETVSSPKDEGIHGCMRVAERLADERNGFLPRQFENPDNASAHRFGTAREMINQLPGGSADAVVAGVGTGGTLVGTYHGLRDHGCASIPIAAKPISRGVAFKTGCFEYAECCSFSKRIPGVVENMSKLYQPDTLDGLMELEVDEVDAINVTRALIRRGFPVGPSSGLNFAAAERAHELLRERGIERPTVATLFCDRMERYFSTELFSDWSSADSPESRGVACMPTG